LRPAKEGLEATDPAEEHVMRRFVLSLVTLVAAGSAGYGQDNSGTLRGVYGPPQSAVGTLRGVYGSPQSLPPPALPSTVTAPDYGTSERGPDVSLPGSADPGETLPEGVKPSPIPGRAGYGRAVVNGRPAIIDMGNNRIVQYSD
jgi:uncharacterized protein DUF1236